MATGKKAQLPDALPTQQPVRQSLHTKNRAPIHCDSSSLTTGIRTGDALKLMRQIPGGDIFDVCIADPPYNIGTDFADGGDDQLPLAEYVEWSNNWVKECLRLTKPSCPIYIYGFAETQAHIAVGYPIENQRWLVWHYTNKAVPSSSFWQRSSEMILCLWKGERPKLNIDLIREPYTESFIKNAAGKERRGTKGRYSRKGKTTIYKAHENGALPRDVISIPALAGGAGRSERWFYCRDCDAVYEPGELKQHKEHNICKHPTQKPLKLSQRLVMSAIKPGSGIALIPFVGSGSECVAAQSVGADYLGFELNSEYVKLAEGRLVKSKGLLI